MAKRGKNLFLAKAPQKTNSVPTKDFFGISSDDMILFWGEDENIHFSQKLKKWFSDLNIRYKKVMEEDSVVEKPLCWIVSLMEYADEEYYRIYTFSGFFQETIEHLSDKRFLALWHIYDEMLHDPKIEKYGSIIFVPEGPEYEHVGLYYYGKPPRRRLKTNWDIMRRKERDNKAKG